VRGMSGRMGTAVLATLAVGGLSVPTAFASAPGNEPEPSGRYVTAAEAVPGVAPPGADETALYRDSAGREISMATSPSEGSKALIGCTPYSGRDNPHRSGTGVAVSGHGWWDKGNCDNDRADVYNCLYEYYTDNSWRQKACSPKKVLKPGGGSSNRTAARHDCDDTQTTSWRNHVDVDVIDEIDTGENPMRQADVACRVY
jgi:hypothetical protein